MPTLVKRLYAVAAAIAVTGLVSFPLAASYGAPPTPDSGEMPPAFGLAVDVMLLGLGLALLVGAYHLFLRMRSSRQG